LVTKHEKQKITWNNDTSRDDNAGAGTERPDGKDIKSSSCVFEAGEIEI
jgi:hypothetical protein